MSKGRKRQDGYVLGADNEEDELRSLLLLSPISYLCMSGMTAEEREIVGVKKEEGGGSWLIYHFEGVQTRQADTLPPPPPS